MPVTEAPALSDEETARLGEWLERENVDGRHIRLIDVLSGGTQNLLVVVETSGGRYVVRRPQHGAGARQREAIVGEARVLRSLESTHVPRARFVGSGNAGTVFPDAPFLVTELVEGFNAAMALPEPFVSQPDLRVGMAHSAVRALASVANVDVTAQAFSWLRTDVPFVADEQVIRWSALLASYRDVPGYRPVGLEKVERIVPWLLSNAPSTVEHGLVHGDFHYGNLLFHYARPEVAAVVDWELARFGAPLTDLGWFLISIPTEERSISRHPLIRAGDHPSRRALVATYAEATGRGVDDVAWFMVFAALKMGAILEGTTARAAAGQASLKTGSLLHKMTVQLLGRAADLIEGAPSGL